LLHDIVCSELYKLTLDPSGSFIAISCFDKTVKLVDFFSGELLASVSAHAELCTALCFTPSGTELVTVGGEGVVCMWRVANVLVKAMKERLLELFVAAQRRNSKARGLAESASTSASFTTSTATATATVTAGAGVEAEAATNEQQSEVQSSLSMLKKKLIKPPSSTAVDSLHSSFLPPSYASLSAASVSAVSVSSSSSSLSSAAAAQVRRSRWQSETPYELFGRRVETSSGDKDKEKHRLTLELTTGNFVSPEKEPQPAQCDEGIAGTHNAASRVEAADEVIQASDSDSDSQPDHRFRANEKEGISENNNDKNEKDDDDEENAYADDDFEAESGRPAQDEQAWENAEKRIDNLEKTASDLESWLEDMVRRLLFIRLLLIVGLLM
jgi:WD40 repeat protein